MFMADVFQWSRLPACCALEAASEGDRASGYEQWRRALWHQTMTRANIADGAEPGPALDQELS